MSQSSILGGESAPARAAGRDADVLGPSDTSDSGSDVQGERTMATDADNPGELGSMTVDLDSDSDAFGTGERGSAAGDTGRDGGDILPDRIVADPDAGDDVLVDAGFTGDIEDIEADADAEADETDPDADAAIDAAEADAALDAAVDADAEAGDTRAGRVFTLPPGTLEAVDKP